MENTTISSPGSFASGLRHGLVAGVRNSVWRKPLPTVSECPEVNCMLPPWRTFLTRQQMDVVTERLNEVYSRRYAKVDPVLDHTQLTSLGKDSW